MRLDDSDRRALKRMLKEERERGEAAERERDARRARAYRRQCIKASRMRDLAWCTYPEIARALGVSEYKAHKMVEEGKGARP